ncbi:hypothetical protein Metlim_0654 [Methanoplanus limicola DSM 2279]|uniref:Uncharacterized protein n=1 Tax=Methanoplanus limicola DSM 2279 TaxID=937775 RepID=H1Z3I2_9EURY|nr:hypothetical protein Metlim_0654 [Methanoplanus limicola DSM 2279]
MRSMIDIHMTSKNWHSEPAIFEKFIKKQKILKKIPGKILTAFKPEKYPEQNHEHKNYRNLQ